MNRAKKPKRSLSIMDCVRESPSALADVQARLPFSLEDAVAHVEGPEKPVEEYLDIESVRLKVARELNREICPGQEETVARLAKLLPGTLVSYVTMESDGRQAKCYFDMQREALIGVIVFSSRCIAD